MSGEKSSSITYLLSYPKRKHLLEIENRLLREVPILCKWDESCVIFLGLSQEMLTDHDYIRKIKIIK